MLDIQGALDTQMTALLSSLASVTAVKVYRNNEEFVDDMEQLVAVDGAIAIGEVEVIKELLAVGFDKNRYDASIFLVMKSTTAEAAMEANVTLITNNLRNSEIGLDGIATSSVVTVGEKIKQTGRISFVEMTYEIVEIQTR